MTASTRGSPRQLACSVIVPVYNCAAYVRECLESILSQKGISLHTLELVLFDDASTDSSLAEATRLAPRLTSALGRVQLLRSDLDRPQGVGSARNRACERSSAPVLVFLDADDVMQPSRVARSIAVLDAGDVGVVGGVFERIPAGSTPRYEQYHRHLTTDALFAHAFRDAPLAFPTVACRREVWEKVGKFVEGRGVAEDLHFLYGAMAAGYKMVKLNGESLSQYRYHDKMTSLTLHRRDLLTVRVAAFEQLVLGRPGWSSGFSIWNSGRDGKEVFKRLSERAQALVRAWGDIDPRKIGKRQRDRPIVHFSELKPPIACCVPLDRDGREFEANLATLKLEPGKDYIHLI